MLKQYLANIYLKIKKYIFLLPAKKEDYFIEHYIFFHLICWLQVKGDAFETSVLIQHLQNLKEYFRKEFIAEQNANSENEREKSSLKNLSPKPSSKISLNKKLEDYTDAELEKAIEELV